LAVDEIAVVGGKHVTSADVATAAGLDASDNLLLVSTGRVASQVEELPWVASAKVDRKLPGTVRVKVVERVARVVLAAGESRWLLDARGNVLGPVTGENAELPVLAAAAVAELEPGTRVPEKEVRDALTALRALAPGIRKEVAALLAPSSERITLSLHDGTQVRFGAAESLDAKNEVLQALLTQMKFENRTGGYIDVRVPTSPAVSATPATGSGATPAPEPSPSL
jgi:cell division protein FtsQ